MKIAIVGSRRMSNYGKKVISKLSFDKDEIVTIEVSGCNREILQIKIKNGGKYKLFSGENFEELNEKVAEYADFLIIIEGGKNSGTILLANKFVEKNKLVYCVPGRIDDDNSWACNWLISQGAIPLIEFDQLTEGDMIDDNDKDEKTFIDS